MKLKPQAQLLIGISVLLILVLVALRRQATAPSREKAAEVQAFEETDESHGVNHFQQTRVTRMNTPPDPTPVRDHKPSSSFLALRIEDYEAQKLRAFGQSYITGVVRGEDNKPLEGARIELFENDPNTTNPALRESVSDKEGSFTLAQLHDGDRRFVLVARAEGYAPEAHFVYMLGRPSEQDIRLERGVKVTGTVRDALTSQPLSNVTIVHPNPGDQVFGVLGSITSSADGSFHFEHVHPGAVITFAQLQGYRSTTAKLRAPNDTAQILLKGGGATIRGITVDRLANKPQGGAKVWLEGMGIADATLSQSDGTFEFTEVPGGNFELYAIRGMRSDKQGIKIGDNEIMENLRIVLPSDLFVSGRLLHANTGRSLPGLKVWYSGPSGKNSVLSDEDGRFAFETLAVSNYTIQIHEKGLLPVSDKRTTSVEEKITRQVPKNASSDQIIIKLRSVPAIEGIVRGNKRRDSPVEPLWGADVAVDYLQEKNHQRIMTKTDVLGKFFVNLPNGRPGEAKLIAFRNNAIDAASIRIPQRRPAQLVLKRTVMSAQVLLSDQEPLEGIKVEFAHFLPDNRPEDQSILIRERDFYTNRGGRLFVPLPENQKVQLTFNTPDGNRIPKLFETDQLLRGQKVFIYDPVTKDILSNANPPKKNPAAEQKKPGGQNPNRPKQLTPPVPRKY